MANLRDTVKDYQEELRDGIAWVAFWKTGRSWNAEYFHLEMGDILYPEDRSRMEEIKQADPAAVVVNGYYSGYLGEDRNLDELTAGVRRHYENGYSNIGEFIEAHDDRLPSGEPPPKINGLLPCVCKYTLNISNCCGFSSSSAREAIGLFVSFTFKIRYSYSSSLPSSSVVVRISISSVSVKVYCKPNSRFSSACALCGV